LIIVERPPVNSVQDERHFGSARSDAADDPRLTAVRVHNVETPLSEQPRQRRYDAEVRQGVHFSYQLRDDHEFDPAPPNLVPKGTLRPGLRTADDHRLEARPISKRGRKEHSLLGATHDHASDHVRHPYALFGHPTTVGDNVA
jgi:hypothetical protein